MLKPWKNNDTTYRRWNTNGCVKKRELLKILDGIGDDDEIWLNVTAGVQCNEALADTVSLFKYKSESGRYDLTFSYAIEEFD